MILYDYSPDDASIYAGFYLWLFGIGKDSSIDFASNEEILLALLAFLTCMSSEFFYLRYVIDSSGGG